MIELTDQLRAELIRRADAESPQEACGLIGGGEAGTVLYAAVNASGSPTDSFVIAPTEQLVLTKRIEADGRELVGIYHSHPHSGPEPSKRDREIARFWPGVVWVIVGRRPCPGEDCTGGEIPVDGETEPDWDICPTCDGAETVPAFWAGFPAA